MQHGLQTLQTYKICDVKKATPKKSLEQSPTLYPPSKNEESEGGNKSKQNKEGEGRGGAGKRKRLGWGFKRRAEPSYKNVDEAVAEEEDNDDKDGGEGGGNGGARGGSVPLPTGAGWMAL
jgi:hypothetical protein